MAPVVLHVAQPTDAGVARWVADHAPRQVAAGWDVHVACPADGWLAEELAATGVAVHRWQSQRAPHRGVVSERRELARVVAAVAPDLVQLHSSKAGLVGRLLLRGRCHTVFAPHAWSFDAVTGPLAAASLQWERVAARWTDRVLCVSESERSRGIEKGVRAAYTVVPNGVDLTAHRAATAADRRQARARLGIDAAGPLAVCVGRLSPQKGQDMLLELWPQVRATLPSAQLALVGAGPSLGSLRRLAGPGVTLAGPTGDPRDWYAAADVVVVPSRWEGMALVPIEAMATSRSVVAFDVTGMSDAVTPVAGALVPAGDLRGFAAAVTARLADGKRADEEGRSGREQVERAHDVDVLARQVLEVYADVLTAPPLRGGSGRRE